MIEEFDPRMYQIRMSKPVGKLITDLDKLGVTTIIYPPNKRFQNILFLKGENKIEISEHSFYRYSGMMQITRTKRDNEGKETNWTEVIPVTDDDWLQKFIKPIVLGRLAQ